MWLLSPVLWSLSTEPGTQRVFTACPRDDCADKESTLSLESGMWIQLFSVQVFVLGQISNAFLNFSSLIYKMEVIMPTFSNEIMDYQLHNLINIGFYY